MPNEDYNFIGAMQTSSAVPSRRVSTDHIPSSQPQRAPSCLELSPSNSLRTFAISLLGHWIYPSVIIVTLCAFVINSTSLIWDQNKVEPFGNSYEDSTWLFWTRRSLCIIILLEIVIKCLARGVLVGVHSFFRLVWDWMDFVSLIVISISIIVPWKAVGTLAAGVAILKLIPIHSGLINAFVSLCSCAKKLIPALVYAIIIVWIYGVVIFTLFIKSQQHQLSVGLSHDHFAETNASVSDSSGNENITKESYASVFVDQSYLTPSTSKQFQNFSFGLSVECLPTNLRSLSGSLILASQMLSLGFSSYRYLESSRNASSLTEFGTMCQYELHVLFVIDTLVIVTGSLPIITITFGTLFKHLQGKRVNGKHRQLNHHRYDNENEQESQTSYQYHHHQQRRSLGSGISGRSINSHTQNYSDEGSSSVSACLNGLFGKVGNILCDCDYYFCCLASLQRRLNPFASQLLKSARYKIFMVITVVVDFLCTLTLLWCSTETNQSETEFSLSWLLARCVQICFVVYTIETVFKWFALSSDEYWKTIWSVFDLILAITYWIGFAVIHIKSWEKFYIQFIGIMMIRMLKICHYWKSFNSSLKLLMISLLRICCYLFVILICSFSISFLQNAVNVPELTRIERSSYFSTDSPSNALFPTLLANIFCIAVLAFLCCSVMAFVSTEIREAQKHGNEKPTNKLISVLLNDCHSDELVNYTNYPRTSFHEAGSPLSITSFSNGVSPTKFSFGTAPSDNGLLTQETQSSILSPTSDILSPLLSLPHSSGLNGHVQSRVYEGEEIPRGFETMTRLEESRKKTEEKCTTERALDYATTFLIITSTFNIAVRPSNDDEVNMSWHTILPKQSLWIEVLFVLGIMMHTVYRTRLCKFSRETFLQVACFYDLLMAVTALMEIFGSGMKWFPVRAAPKGVKMIAECAKIISACRGLMLISRLAWLRDTGKMLVKVLWDCANVFIALSYLLFIFMISSIELQKFALPVSNSLNYTSRINASTNEDSADIDVFKCSLGLLVCSVIVAIIVLGALLGTILCKHGNWTDILYLFGSATRLRRPSSRIEDFYGTSFQAMNQPSEGRCVPVLFFVTNHPKFDIIVMTIILLDGLGITFEHFATSERALILRKHYPAYMVFLYAIELAAKLGGNGKKFFKYNWNIFDLVVITTTFIGFVLNHILEGPLNIPLLLLHMRFFRLLRILQFHLYAQHAQIVHNFFNIVPHLLVPIRNFATFYFCLFLVVVTFKLRCYQFIQVQDTIVWTAAPFQVISISAVYETLGNLQISHLATEYVYEWCLVLFSIIRASTIFSIWLLLVASICGSIAEKETTTPCPAPSLADRSQYRFHDGHANESAEYNDKYSYLLPCASPETIDLETPSTSGTNYRRHSSASGFIEPILEEPKCSSQNSTLNTNKLYKTTTITSSEEINGCQVFYVEAMITTV